MPGDGFEHLWAISTSPQGAEEVLKRVIVLRQGESGALECVPMRSVPTSLTIRKRAALVRRWYGVGTALMGEQILYIGLREPHACMSGYARKHFSGCVGSEFF